MSKKKNFSSFSCKRGYPLPGGAVVVENGINFTLFSRHATAVHLVIEREGHGQTLQRIEIPFDPNLNRTGDIWHILLITNERDFSYGYRISGTSDIQKTGLIFNNKQVLIDPYCQNIKGRKWGAPSFPNTIPVCRLSDHEFDWQNDRPLKIPMVDSIIYELHVRGFTRDQSSQVKNPGSYLGIIEKIPYLTKLGVTAVELMPVTEWDENDNTFTHPESGEKLKNFWGYNPISFFALKSGLAANHKQHIKEFKTMVRSLHQAGIEVILDMVYNHTGEGGYEGNSTSFRGIDNTIYYLLDKNSGHHYLNYSGCGNTFNCNHPVVREFILRSLRYWVMEMHVDGFRFDLASILGRDSNGEVLANPPMIEMIAQDPILRDTKIIAEAWDAAGLYQVGSFSRDSRWAEWNGKFRDDIRAFMAGHSNSIANLATRIAGSSDLYQSSDRTPCNSINFITSHDGFTLFDLVSYEKKANHNNGEDNRDGDNHNLSWNSGVEGKSNDPEIHLMRMRRIRSFGLLLFLSQGVPMITAGDEFGRSQAGNNNSWCQDNATSWVDWTLCKKNSGLLRFFRKCILLRKTYPIFRRRNFFQNSSDAEIIWHSLQPDKEDWSGGCHTLAFTLKGGEYEPDFLILLNGQRVGDVEFNLPRPSQKKGGWACMVDTARKSPNDFPKTPFSTRQLERGRVRVLAMAAVVLRTTSVQKQGGYTFSE